MKRPTPEQTILIALAGSHAHGTARAGSDVDLRGVAIAPLTERLSLFGTTDQFEGKLGDDGDRLSDLVLPSLRRHPTAAAALEVKTELVIFDIAKFLTLCAAGNPSALEILFADERDWIVATEAWRRIHAERHRFLTTKVQQTFLGYAMAQLKRIRTHRAWLLEPPTRKPERADFGLPTSEGTLGADDRGRIERAVADAVRSYGIDELEMPVATRLAVHDRIRAFQRDRLSVTDAELEPKVVALATASLHLPADVAATLTAERRYRAALRQWEAYESWRVQRNPMRAELERRHGYDTKHAMHLIRLMRMGLEVVEEGELRVRRDDAEELMRIRDGALSYDALLEQAETLRERMEAARGKASLPAEVDTAFVDGLAVERMLAGQM